MQLSIAEPRSFALGPLDGTFPPQRPPTEAQPSHGAANRGKAEISFSFKDSGGEATGEQRTLSLAVSPLANSLGPQ